MHMSMSHARADVSAEMHRVHTETNRYVSLLSERRIPSTADTCIVGGGATGIIVASRLKTDRSDESLVVFERSNMPGGVWAHHANSTSRVNSSEPSYRIAAHKMPTNHSHAHEVLCACTDALRSLGTDVLYVNTDVSSVARAASNTGWSITGTSGVDRLHFCTHASLVVLAINRRLGIPRTTVLPGEAKFKGRVFRGLADDVQAQNVYGEDVAVIGMGAFAIENVRTCLEMGARHVSVVARRRGTSCPQIIDWANFARPFFYEDADENPHHLRAGSMKLFDMWRQAYKVSGAVEPECWSDNPSTLKPDGHTIATSDVFFVAHWLKKLRTFVGTDFDVTDNTLDFTNSLDGKRTSVPVRVVVKCVGFQVQERNEQILNHQTFNGLGLVDQNLWAIFEPHLDHTSFQQPFGSSILNWVEFRAKMVSFVARSTTKVHDVIYRSSPPVRINTLTFEQAIRALKCASDVEPQLKGMLRKHLDDVRRECADRHTIDDYVSTNRATWAALHTSLTVTTASDAMPYLFDDVRSILRDELSLHLQKRHTSLSHAVVDDIVETLGDKCEIVSGLLRHLSSMSTPQE